MPDPTLARDLLTAESLTSGYNGVAAVTDVNLTVAAGEVLSVLGPNGAGKTTTLLALAGLLPAMSGRTTAMGEPVDYKRPYRMARRGMRFVPDDRGLFSVMTVREHLRLSRRRPDRAREEFVLDRFPALAEVQSRIVGLLSGGEQQMLAIAVALLAEPRVLMVDEMSLGLAPMVVEQMLPTIRDLARDEGIAVVLVEQHVELALAVSDRAIVLNHGRMVLEGDAKDLLADRDRLETAYFGGESL
ncbi:ATP-binding cassette domain-containing protein [Rhodococcus sp. USK13]|uniref:ABC transporter ATP-binding protein n=1 Tax=Rhodococcus sp. USK13 TaxID=2806442 RepID=UPI001BCB37F5|nr:ATP-binding cassette domain-containing protein [Rhodococcus sp. USK13]